MRRTGLRRPSWSRLQKNEPARRLPSCSHIDDATELFPHPATPYSQKSLDGEDLSSIHVLILFRIPSRVPSRHAGLPMKRLSSGGTRTASSFSSSIIRLRVLMSSTFFSTTRTPCLMSATSVLISVRNACLILSLWRRSLPRSSSTRSWLGEKSSFANTAIGGQHRMECNEPRQLTEFRMTVA